MFRVKLVSVARDIASADKYELSQAGFNSGHVVGLRMASEEDKQEFKREKAASGLPSHVWRHWQSGGFKQALHPAR